MALVGFTIAIYLHALAEVKAWVWVPIGLLVFDHVARYTWATYVNLAIFYRSDTGKLQAAASAVGESCFVYALTGKCHSHHNRESRYSLETGSTYVSRLSLNRATAESPVYHRNPTR